MTEKNVTVVAEVIELAFIRIDGGQLQHWSLFRDRGPEDRGLEPIAPEDEETVLAGAARQDWDMSEKSYPDWGSWRSSMNAAISERLDDARRIYSSRNQISDRFSPR